MNNFKCCRIELQRIKHIAFFLSLVSFSLLLTGCLGVDEAHLFIDLDNMVGEIRYINIFSDSTEKEKVEADFKELIYSDYLGTSFDEGFEWIKVNSKELYEENGQLNGKVLFSFSNLEGVLEDFDIEIDSKGDYIVELDSEIGYTGGNGEYVEQDDERIVTWDKGVRKIELNLRLKRNEDGKITSLNPHWLKWKEQASGENYFDSPEEAVEIITNLLDEKDFRTLAKYYDLSGSKVKRSDLESGDFFIEKKQPEATHPAGFWHYRHPFAPGFEYKSMRSSKRKGVYEIEVGILIDQGEGLPEQRGLSYFYMIKSDKGWKVLPDKVHIQTISIDVPRIPGIN